ncbi:MAG: sulfite exporter TauE/SafE family protein [Alphaproteobacteria bacterium]|nr:sulfite exporter TauE/SafE family protein [Alphaproteobacteria bacterium]
MVFGVISNTLLISMGVPPAAASADVHATERFTTAASVISHIAHRNINWRLSGRLVIPGVAAGILDTYALARISAEAARPIVLAYLPAIGLCLLWRGIKFPPLEKMPKFEAPLGLVGGFLDAAGGGGWGRTTVNRARRV